MVLLTWHGVSTTMRQASFLGPEDPHWTFLFFYSCSGQILTRRPQCIYGLPQQFRPCGYVYLLLTDCTKSQVQEQPLVEEIHHPVANCKDSKINFSKVNANSYAISQIQFFLITTHWMVLYFVSCNYPKFVIIVLVPQNLFMFALFTDFYIKAYIKKKPKSPAKEVTPSDGISGKKPPKMEAVDAPAS